MGKRTIVVLPKSILGHTFVTLGDQVLVSSQFYQWQTILFVLEEREIQNKIQIAPPPFTRKFQTSIFCGCEERAKERYQLLLQCTEFSC
jgi:hypothetical protein